MWDPKNYQNKQDYPYSALIKEQVLIFFRWFIIAERSSDLKIFHNKSISGF